jgi:hypothetical protein
MTTAFTAIPMKMTMSASRFLVCDMKGLYSTTDSRIIDTDQFHRIFPALEPGVRND